MDDEKDLRIKQLQYHRQQLADDPLTLWIQEYAETVRDTVRRLELIAMANERKANANETIMFIDEELESLKDA